MAKHPNYYDLDDYKDSELYYMILCDIGYRGKCSFDDALELFYHLNPEYRTYDNADEDNEDSGRNHVNYVLKALQYDRCVKKINKDYEITSIGRFFVCKEITMADW